MLGRAASFVSPLYSILLGIYAPKIQNRIDFYYLKPNGSKRLGMVVELRVQSRVSNRNSFARNCAKVRATALELRQLRAIMRNYEQFRASKIHLRWKP